MRILTKEFSRLARKFGIDDESLGTAIDDADRGLIEADLGSHLIKQRIARKGAGKSGGYRIIIYYRRASRSVFLHIFAKKAKANLNAAELEAYRDFARILDDLTERQLLELVDRRGWRVIQDAEEGS